MPTYTTVNYASTAGYAARRDIIDRVKILDKKISFLEQKEV